MAQESPHQYETYNSAESAGNLTYLQKVEDYNSLEVIRGIFIGKSINFQGS